MVAGSVASGESLSVILFVVGHIRVDSIVCMPDISLTSVSSSAVLKAFCMDLIGEASVPLLLSSPVGDT